MLGLLILHRRMLFSYCLAILSRGLGRVLDLRCRSTGGRIRVCPRGSRERIRADVINAF